MLLRRFVVAVLLLLVAVGGPSFSAEELLSFDDQVTGSTLLIPRQLQGQEKRSQYGLSWQTDNLSISTLKFPPERSLQDIYETIKTRRGRRVMARQSG